MDSDKLAVLGGLAALVGVGLVALASKPSGNLIEHQLPNPKAREDPVVCLKKFLAACIRSNNLYEFEGVRLREIIALLERVPPEHRDRVASALWVLDREGPLGGNAGDLDWPEGANGCLPAWSNPGLSPAYPHIPLRMQAKLVLGMTPAELSGDPAYTMRLTPREAHEWLSEINRRQFGGSSYTVTPAQWLLQHAKLTATQAHRTVPLHLDVLITIPLARWLIAANRDLAKHAALMQQRIEQGPYGEEIRGRWIDRIDELRTDDLRPSVRETFARAMTRQRLEAEKEMATRNEPLTPPPTWWKPMPHAQLLLTPADLILEGKAMKHCAATYVAPVREGYSVIVALDSGDCRSTVEIRRSDVEVLQHRTIGNYPPSQACRELLAEYLLHWRARHG